MRNPMIMTDYETLGGEKKEKISPQYLKEPRQEITQVTFAAGGYAFTVTDCFQQTAPQKIKITRRIEGKPQEIFSGSKKDGISIGMEIPLDEKQPLRYGIPSAVYQEGKIDNTTFMEDRLSAPLVMAYNSSRCYAVILKKLVPVREVGVSQRVPGQSRCLHQTENTSIGYGYSPERGNAFLTCWPYEEKDHSAALNAKKTPFKAFYPLNGQEVNIKLVYEYEEIAGSDYTCALYQAFTSLSDAVDLLKQDPAVLPFSREQAVEYRKDSLKKSYREFDGNGAGFFFHFDPQRGYGSEPTGFGASFSTIPHETYVHILEYGFTGRQLDTAWQLLDEGREWQKKACKVIDFFLDKCMTENGWLYSLYDLEMKRGFCSFGDPQAPKLHYVDFPGRQGNYLRTMTEPMNDLIKCYQWFAQRGEEHSEWLEAVARFAHFLLESQNEDGSWYRAYALDKTPVFMDESGGTNDQKVIQGRKAATAIPIVFLCNMAQLCPADVKYLEAAKRAGEYTLAQSVRNELYQGGTLDNPNIVDKEAAQFVMAGLYRLYEQTGREHYLSGAVQAAKQFVTWNYIWNAPMQEGTILYEKNFRTKGMGAINSVWCGGVVDIYSLFHARELYLIGRESKDTFMQEMADWISIAAHQILSWPGDLMTFTDSGMQPEGFGICGQGMDEGMIKKGDIWGTLGWIYSAGIGGTKRYLKERNQVSDDK